MSSSQHPSTVLDSTSSHPPSGPYHPDASSSTDTPTPHSLSTTQALNASTKDGLPTSDSPSTSELTSRSLDTTTALSSADLPIPPSHQKQTDYINQAKAILTSHIPSHPDFPEPGILFYDILPLFYASVTQNTLLNALKLLIALNFSPENRPDIVVGLEARGFLFGPALARCLDIGFVPVRKPGKLPGKTETAEYKKEYGADKFEIQSEGIARGKKVLIVDDVIATGGSAAACGDLVEKVGGVLLGYAFILELAFLKGREKLRRPAYALLTEKDMENKG